MASLSHGGHQSSLSGAFRKKFKLVAEVVWSWDMNPFSQS